MGVVKLFPNRYSYKKLGTHYLCDNMKKLEHILEILILKFLANF